MSDRDKDGEPRAVKLKTLGICAILLLAGAIALFIIFNTEPTARRDGAVRQSASLVEVTYAERGRFRPQIETLGSVLPAQEIALSARVEGDILELSEAFVPGGYVSAGESLVQISDEDYRIELAQARAALAQAEADRDIVRAEQSAAEADYRQFNRDLPPERRALVLREPQGRAAEARVQTAEAAVRQAQLNLERTTLSAPFDAHVLSREVNLGSRIAPGTVLGQLVGLDSFWVEVTLPIAQLQWLDLPEDGRPGSAVELRNRNAWPEGAVRNGRVFRVIGSLEAETRLARVLVEVADPLARGPAAGQPRLLLGEFLSARIEGRPIDNIVRLPREFLRADRTVWLMVDERLEIRPVSVVFEDARFAYIDQGLSPEDAVVTTRLATVQPGLRLRLDTDPPPADATGNGEQL